MFESATVELVATPLARREGVDPDTVRDVLGRPAFEAARAAAVAAVEEAVADAATEVLATASGEESPLSMAAVERAADVGGTDAGDVLDVVEAIVDAFEAASGKVLSPGGTRRSKIAWAVLRASREAAGVLLEDAELVRAVGEACDADGEPVLDCLDRHLAAAEGVYRGRLERADGDLDAAEGRFRESLGVWRDAGDARLEAVALSNLGAAALDGSDLGRAEALFVESLRKRREVGDRDGEVVQLVFLGDVARRRGDRTAAGDHLEAALSGARAIGDDARVALVRLHQGVLARDAGALATAKLRFTESHDRYRAAGDLRGRVRALEWLGWVVRRLQGPPAARSYYEGALVLAVGGDEAGPEPPERLPAAVDDPDEIGRAVLGDPADVTRLFQAVVVTCVRARDLDAARDCHRRWLAYARATDDVEVPPELGTAGLVRAGERALGDLVGGVDDLVPDLS